MELFKIGGFCPETNYIFMGMYRSVNIEIRLIWT